jgi:hypothetical protein
LEKLNEHPVPIRNVPGANLETISTYKDGIRREKLKMDRFFSENDELTDLCLNTETKSWERLVSWAGMETLKITRIPQLNLWKDIPQLSYAMRLQHFSDMRRSGDIAHSISKIECYIQIRIIAAV